MGISFFTAVVYGFKETAEQRKARDVVEDREILVCAGDPQNHKVNPWSPPAFCAQCGSKVEKRMFPTTRTVAPSAYYSAPGWDTLDEGVRYDKMVNTYVHEASPNEKDGAVILGVQLALYRTKEVEGAFEIPEVTPEQVMEVDKLLLHNGISPNPGDLKVYLLIGGY